MGIRSSSQLAARFDIVYVHPGMTERLLQMTDSERELERQELRNIHSVSQFQPPSMNSSGGRDSVDT